MTTFLFDINVVYNVIGLTGVICYVTGFVGLQMYGWQAHGYAYLICNFLGALLTLVSLMYSFNLASFVTQLIWLAVSFYSIFKEFKGKISILKQTSENPELVSTLTPRQCRILKTFWWMNRAR